MATSYRLKHLLTGRLSEIVFGSATSSAIFVESVSPRTASEYITVPVVGPCDCGKDLRVETVCCRRVIPGALGSQAYCPECRCASEVVHVCPDCSAELDPTPTLAFP